MKRMLFPTLAAACILAALFPLHAEQTPRAAPARDRRSRARARDRIPPGRAGAQGRANRRRLRPRHDSPTKVRATVRSRRRRVVHRPRCHAGPREAGSGRGLHQHIRPPRRRRGGRVARHRRDDGETAGREQRARAEDSARRRPRRDRRPRQLRDDVVPESRRDLDARQGTGGRRRHSEDGGDGRP